MKTVFFLVLSILIVGCAAPYRIEQASVDQDHLVKVYIKNTGLNRISDVRIEQVDDLWLLFGKIQSRGVAQESPLHYKVRADGMTADDEILYTSTGTSHRASPLKRYWVFGDAAFQLPLEGLETYDHIHLSLITAGVDAKDSLLQH